MHPSQGVKWNNFSRNLKSLLIQRLSWAQQTSTASNSSQVSLSPLKPKVNNISVKIVALIKKELWRLMAVWNLIVFFFKERIRSLFQLTSNLIYFSDHLFYIWVRTSYARF
jgi:hypothetical protein